MNHFEVGTRRKYRFLTSKGELTIEQLWDLPLESRTGFDLDSIAKAINKELKNFDEESFVKTDAPNPRKGILESMLAILRHIIQHKIAANQAVVNAAIRREEANKLQSILAKKQDAALETLSESELQARLAQLTASGS